MRQVSGEPGGEPRRAGRPAGLQDPVPATAPVPSRVWCTLTLLLLLPAGAGCASQASQGRTGAPGARGPGLGSAPLPSSPLAGTWHTVARGETLQGLALRYGVPLQDLAEINDLEQPDRIFAGRELFIPTASSAAQAPPTKEAPQATGEAKEQRLEKPKGLFRWPLDRGRLTSRFGRRWGRQHEGIDLAAPMKTPIRAAADGTVIFAGTARGYGNVVLLKHGARYVTVYAHNDANLVQQGQTVKTGQTIALLGNTGQSTGPHTHFEIRDNGKPRNPLFFLELSDLRPP